MQDVRHFDQPRDDECGRDAREVVELDSGHCGDFERCVRGGAEALGLKAVDQLGWEMPIDIMIDSAVVKSMERRLGLGKHRHIEVKLLWVQAVVHHQDSWHHKPCGHRDQAEVNRRHWSSAGWCRRLHRLGEVSRRKFCPEQLCAHVQWGPNPAGQAVGGWTVV